ncbi:MAG: hypothetical protein CGW95_16775 [Phenylobacterium zucineum]|nr:MAG: hypothetical protein CGW95_16775 [Phenylobacterium zucineum]
MVRRALSAMVCITTLVGCAPGLPKGVSSERLEAALDDRVADLNTCVLIGQAGTGRVVFRYGTHVVCGQAWPTCQGTDLTSAVAQLPLVAKSRSPSNRSCPTKGDHSRSVGWASGPVEGHADLVYVTIMEGTTAPPGMIVAEHTARALRDAGF